MKTPTYKALILTSLSMFAAASVYAGAANTHIYWTRGYDGTIDGYNATTTNDIYDEDFNFTERMIAGANNIHELDALNPNRVDQTTGARTADSTTPTVKSDGSLYLHIGYINSGFTGAGTTINAINLNETLVVGRIGIENGYQRPEGTYFTTPNIPTKITAGANDYYLVFDYQYSGAETSSANELMFFRRNAVDTAATFQLDCNIEITNLHIASNKSLFPVSSYNHLIIGSTEYDRRLDVLGDAQTVAENIFFINQNAKLTVYSDLHWNGSTRFGYRGYGETTIYGNSYVNLTGVTGGTFFIHLSGGANAAYDPGKITVNGNVYVNKIGTTSADWFRLLRLNNPGQSAVVNGNIEVNAVGYHNPTSATDARAVLFHFNVSDNTIEVNGNITINQANRNFTMFSSDTGALSNDNIIFNGKITLANTSGASEMIMGRVWTGLTVTYYGKIDGTARTQQTSYASSARGAIINFKGKEDNVSNNMGFRVATYNLMNTSGSAMKLSSYFALGGAATVNIFGQDQLKLSASQNLSLWGPTSKLSGTINLNGTNLVIGTFNPAGADRYMIVDFGMSESGMTAAQMTANGITADMINATGKGIAQTFTITNINYHSAATVELCYILFKNYVVGEDTIISKIQLSKRTIGTSSCFSVDDITQNVLRIDGYTDATKYGVEYYLQETALIDGTWKYDIVLVPEPSTIAAILGFVALAFAAYRRKK